LYFILSLKSNINKNIPKITAVALKVIFYLSYYLCMNIVFPGFVVKKG